MSLPHPHLIPARAGLGLKAEHYRDILETRPALGFFEVHAENYMGAGGPPHAHLTAIRRDYPLSLHGVGLSIGGESELDKDHLARLQALCERYEPGLFSEHLAWSTHDQRYFADLLPLPYTQATLVRAAAHIGETQEALGRQMLLENPSSYLAFEESTMSEAQFIGDVAKRSGCALLLDLNNVFVSARNLGFDPWDYLRDFPLDLVREIHLAGHDARPEGDGAVLIDAHGSPVAEDVWLLYEGVVGRIGPVPTLIERDNDVPPLAALLAEAARVEGVLAQWKQAA